MNTRGNNPHSTTTLNLECPHCHQTIELMEPKDLDDRGLTPNVRGPAVESGELKTWARLRGGRFFLFLKKDVEDYLDRRTADDFQKVLKRAGMNNLSREEQLEQIKRLEEAVRQQSEVEAAAVLRGSKS